MCNIGKSELRVPQLMQQSHLFWLLPPRHFACSSRRQDILKRA
jgi:hypothetical protein